MWPMTIRCIFLFSLSHHPPQCWYLACHLPMLGREPGHRQESNAFRPPSRCHNQHGRYSALWGRGRHLHRSDERNRSGLGPDYYCQVRMWWQKYMTTHLKCHVQTGHFHKWLFVFSHMETKRHVTWNQAFFSSPNVNSTFSHISNTAGYFHM